MRAQDCGPMRVLRLTFALVAWLQLVQSSSELERAAWRVDAALQQLGRSVRDWESFSPSLNSSIPCGDPAPDGSPAPPRVRYFTRHTGTLWDWMAVAATLGLNWDRRNPESFGDYGMGTAAADEVWRRNGSELCGPDRDAMVYCDTVVDARPALQGGCSKPIVLVVTNRFDWKARDPSAYLALMQRAAANERVWWVTNNPFEALHMEWQGLKLPPARHLMLRPLGAMVLPPQSLPPPALGRFAVVLKRNRRKHPDRDVLLPQLKRLGLLEGAVQVYDGMYGGPAALAQHRAVLHLPYQVSIMSFYETLAAGGLFVVPSPVAFRAMRHRHRFAFALLPLISRAPRQGRNWSHYMEFYHPDFAPAMVYFDSWEHLGNILRMPENHGMWEEKRSAARRVMAAVRRRSVDGWRRLMTEVGAAACGRKQ